MTMYENPEHLKKQISLGEDTSLEINDPRYSGGAMSSPHSNSMTDELAAMAHTASGVFVLGVDDKTRTTGLSRINSPKRGCGISTTPNYGPPSSRPPSARPHKFTYYKRHGRTDYEL
jgi:hypothetical protein